MLYTKNSLNISFLFINCCCLYILFNNFLKYINLLKNKDKIFVFQFWPAKMKLFTFQYQQFNCCCYLDLNLFLQLLQGLYSDKTWSWSYIYNFFSFLLQMLSLGFFNILLLFINKIIKFFFLHFFFNYKHLREQEKDYKEKLKKKR